MNEITTTVFGNIASEPRHLITPQGAPLTSFRMASTTTRFDQGLQGYVDGHTTWLTVSCWRGLAFNAAASLRKGQPVIVHGALHVRDWQDGDRSGREVELHAVSIGHDLRRGRADFARVTRPVLERVLVPGAAASGSAGPSADLDAGESDRVGDDPWDGTAEPMGDAAGGAAREGKATETAAGAATLAATREGGSAQATTTVGDAPAAGRAADAADVPRERRSRGDRKGAAA